MKKLNSLIIILLTFAAFNVSAQNDVGCTAVNTPAQGDTVYAGIPVQPNYTRKNFGTALPANHPDQISMNVTVNGIAAGTFNRNMASAFASGADETISGQPIDFGTLTPALTDGNQKVCIFTTMPNDSDNKNDTSCVTVYYSTTPPPSDVAVIACTVTDPVPVGTDFEADQQLQAVTFTLQNAGTTDIPAGGSVIMTLDVGAGTQNLTLTLQAGIAVGATTNASASRAQIAALLDFPTTLGNFDVCMTAAYIGDNNSANDKFCTTYNLLASTTPSITSFSPSSAKCKETVTISGTNFDPTPANNTVKFRGVAATVITATATTLTVEVPETANGFISVEVTVGGTVKKGESATAFVYDGCDASATAINEINNKFGKVFYVNNGLNIVANTGQAGAKKIQVVNMTGQIIFQEVRDLQENSVEIIDLSFSPSGMYVVNVDGYSSTFVK